MAAVFLFRAGFSVANHPKVTANKRARERARQEWQKEKQARREENKARKGSAPRSSGGEDPDIAGIVPGPQASPWGDELMAPADDDTNSTNDR